MTKQIEALKLALEALEWNLPVIEDYGTPNQLKMHHKALTTIYEALADSALDKMAENARELGLDYEQDVVLPGGGHTPAVPVAVYGYCPECGGAGVMRERRPNGDDKCTNGHKYPSSKALAEQPEPPPECQTEAEKTAFAFGWWKALEENRKQPAQQQKEGFASPGGGYVPAIPRPMPLDWKLVPRKATPEMQKAMDECAQEGYDERLYAGMASSVYMAAWDASPVMGTLPEQPAQQQEPVAVARVDDLERGGRVRALAMGLSLDALLYTSPPAQRKPLTDEQICRIGAQVHGFLLCNEGQWGIEMARAIEAAHGIKE